MGVGICQCTKSSGPYQFSCSARVDNCEIHQPGSDGIDRIPCALVRILKDLGVRKMTLLASPRKMPSMTGFDLEVMGFKACPDN